MGQPVTVLVKPSSRPGVVRFDINRSLTSMAGERYCRGDEVDDDRPVDELARRMLAESGVEAVHIAANVITVEVDRPGIEDDLRKVIEDLFLFYGDGDAAGDPEAEPAGTTSES